MDSQISQQTRQNAAHQFRQWASARNVSLAQIEQMVTAMLSGKYDAKILQAMPPAQNVIPATQQPDIFFGSDPAFTFPAPFEGVPFLPIPPMPILPISTMRPPPSSMVPDMFPTMTMQTASQFPMSESTRTTFPGGEALQQNSSYSGQHGNTSFQYNSSSTSMTFIPDVQLPLFQPPPSMPTQQVQQPVIPIMPPSAAQQHPKYRLQPVIFQPATPQPAFSEPMMPQPPLLQPEQTFKSNVQPQHDQAHNAPNFPAPTMEVPAPPEPVFNPAAADQAPQNPRLAGRLKQKLNEATYFSEVPGMPDRSVQR